MKSAKFILPDRSAVERAAVNGKSYALKNYYGWGPIAAAKRRRFEKALSLAAKAGATRVIDMGCADGLLLPSLAKHYEQVTAIDIHPPYASQSQALVDETGLANVKVLCSAGLSPAEIRGAIGSGYQLMVLLETLEHVGSQPDIWSSKVSFLTDCFTLLEPQGQIVITVPKMVGPILLFKNLLQRALRIGHDDLTYPQLFRSALFKDTDAIEPLWHGGHVGFNHLKLDRHLEANFKIIERGESSISVFYRICLRGSTAG